ncbi:MAG: phosphoribosylglycinamide formyltransferase [Chloroflexi bacterium]|nr:phosphoribosylglycinamide formyltransferase [Chloroflexota bacterium]
MTRSAPLRLGVLFSGAGTNLKAILDACERRAIDAEVRVAITNRPAAPGIQFGRDHGVPTLVFARADYPSRAAQQAAMADALVEHEVELAVTPGLDQILRGAFQERFDGPRFNIHPSLLPAFGGGLHAARDALDWGAKVTGVTVHFSTDDLDAGPIILQEALPIEEGDTEESLMTRIHEVEHRLLPAAIQLFAEDRLQIEGRRVRILPPQPVRPEALEEQAPGKGQDRG